MTARKQLISYWADKFKILPSILESTGTSFFPRSHLNESQKIITFQTKKRDFIFYPDIYAELFSRLKLSNQSIEIEQLDRCLPSLSLTQRGTDYYFYWMFDLPLFKTVKNIRLLQLSDETALEVLKQSVTSRERELGDIDIRHPVVMGYFSDNKLLSVGSLIVENNIADIGILTHSEARGKGIGKSIVLALIVEGLKMNLLVQYTSMQKNIASVALANSLGFERFATETYWSIDARL